MITIAVESEVKRLSKFFDPDGLKDSNRCWIWKGAHYPDGYGQSNSSGRKIRVSRLMFDAQYGSLPPDMCVLHRCDVPACCNPLHLFPGTHRDNAVDRNSKGRQARGERHGLAKLTSLDVIEMRRLASSGTVLTRIAEQFGIRLSTVSEIVSRKRWRHL